MKKIDLTDFKDGKKVVIYQHYFFNDDLHIGITARTPLHERWIIGFSYPGNSPIHATTVACGYR